MRWGTDGAPLFFYLIMKRFSFILLTLCCCTSIFAEKLEDRYVMKMADGWQLYYICEQEIPALERKIKPMTADFTYPTYSDSITMNISVFASDILATDSIVLAGKNRKVIRDFKTFFIEKENKLWTHRYNMRFPFENAVQLYNDPSPYTLTVYAQGKVISYSFSPKAWQKEKDVMQQIFRIIYTNKRLYQTK